MRTAGVVFVCAAVALPGCGSDASQQIKDKVTQFVTSARSHDYGTICDQVLAPSLVSRVSAAGVTCEQAMQIGFGGVQDPTLSIGKIVVRGSTATVITLSGARGQTSSIDALELTKTSHGWRISSLGAPTLPKRS